MHQGGAALWVYFGLARVVAALQFSRLENERGQSATLALEPR